MFFSLRWAVKVLSCLMTQITHDQLFDVLQAVKARKNGVQIEKYGYVIRIEERLDCGSHIGASMKVHPGTDTLDCALLDCLAMAKDYGVRLVK